MRRACIQDPKASSKWRRPRALMFSSTGNLRAGGLLSNFSHHFFQNFCRSKSASRVNVVPVGVSVWMRETRNTRISRCTRPIRYQVSTFTTSAYGSTR